jgi:uncharacterized protein YukE
LHRLEQALLDLEQEQMRLNQVLRELGVRSFVSMFAAFLSLRAQELEEELEEVRKELEQVRKELERRAPREQVEAQKKMLE